MTAPDVTALAAARGSGTSEGSDMTDSLDAIRARHVPTNEYHVIGEPSVICAFDKQLWYEGGCDTAIVLAALDAALARERRLREALDFIADSYDAYIEAHAGRGHTGPHEPSSVLEGGCMACAGAEYGTEVTMGEYALPQARAALAETPEAGS